MDSCLQESGKMPDCNCSALIAWRGEAAHEDAVLIEKYYPRRADFRFGHTPLKVRTRVDMTEEYKRKIRTSPLKQHGKASSRIYGLDCSTCKNKLCCTGQPQLEVTYDPI